MSSVTSPISPALHVVVLAAGSGSRFDPSGREHKLLAKLANGQTVVRQSAWRIQQAVQLFQQSHSATVSIQAVVRSQGSVEQALQEAGLKTYVAPHADQGMGASLAYAVSTIVAQAISPAAWLIALADMPYVQPETVGMLLAKLHEQTQAGQTDVIIAPKYRGQRGHPVGFGPAHTQALMQLRGDQGARSILIQHAVTHMQVDDPGICQDIDTPADLGLMQPSF